MEIEMSDRDLKQKRSNRFTKNKYDKALRDQLEPKSLRVVDPRKGEYKRKKVRITDYDRIED